MSAISVVETPDGPRDSQAVETATQTLHRLTSYTWAWYEPSRENDDLVWSVPVDDPRVVRDFQPTDMERLPWFYKRYDPTLPRVPLPRDLPSTTASAVDVLAGIADVAPADLDLPNLARMLHLSAGVVRTTEHRNATWLFRAAGSAGARFPLEIYVAVPDGLELPAGVHWYHPVEHALVQVGAAAARRRSLARRHRRAVAHRMAVPRTRVPARVLGRRDDALPTPRGGRLRRAHCPAAHTLPGRGESPNWSARTACTNGP